MSRPANIRYRIVDMDGDEIKREHFKAWGKEIPTRVVGVTIDPTNDVDEDDTVTITLMYLHNER